MTTSPGEVRAGQLRSIDGRSGRPIRPLVGALLSLSFAVGCNSGPEAGALPHEDLRADPREVGVSEAGADVQDGGGPDGTGARFEALASPQVRSDPIRANEPPNHTPVTDQPWNALASLDWKHENRESESVIVEDPTAPVSPPNVIEHRYPEGFPAGQEPAVDFFFVQGRTLYLSVQMLVSPNWTNHRSYVNKVFFLWTAANSPFQIHFFHVPDAGAWTFRTAATTALHLDPNVRPLPTFSAGEWVHLEWLVEHRADTTWRVRWWIDGEPAGDHSDVPMPDAPFAQFEIAPTWGGGGTFKPQDEYLRFDHLYLSQ